MTAVSDFSTGVPAAGKMTAAGKSAVDSAVPTAPLLPVRRLNELTRSPEVAPAVNTPAPQAPVLTAEQVEHNKPVYFGATSAGGVDGATVAARSIGGSDFPSSR